MNRWIADRVTEDIYDTNLLLLQWSCNIWYWFIISGSFFLEYLYSNSFFLFNYSQLIASGPFTTTDNLLFEPLIELLAYATRKLPQLLILVWTHLFFIIFQHHIWVTYLAREVSYFFTYWHFSQLGPFVDSEHPEIKKGTVDRSFDEIFHMEILRRVYTQ